MGVGRRLRKGMISDGRMVITREISGDGRSLTTGDSRWKCGGKKEDQNSKVCNAHGEKGLMCAHT